MKGATRKGKESKRDCVGQDRKEMVSGRQGETVQHQLLIGRDLNRGREWEEERGRSNEQMRGKK